ncbi:hypothetical protein BY996DRAFT_6583692 [Phakopsora pachyrhizi]|nr:hypothetical protein BY996DRAFT_6583692 [Phakopsora pachyrhizi]
MEFGLSLSDGMDERLEVSRKLPLWVSPTLPMSLFEKEVRHERDKGPFSSSVSSFEVSWNLFILSKVWIGKKYFPVGQTGLDEFEVVRGRALKGSFESNDDLRGEGLRFKPFDQRIRGCPNGAVIRRSYIWLGNCDEPSDRVKISDKVKESGDRLLKFLQKKKTDFDRQNREICKREEKGRRDHNSQDILADPSLLAIGAKNTILYRIRGQKDVDCCTILRPEKMEKAKVDEFEGDEACAMDCLYIDTYSRWEVEKSLQIHNIRPITHTQPPRGD